MPGYAEFARFYDRLMSGVNYAEHANTCLNLLKAHGKEPALVLDLACGTGSFSLELARQGLEVIGVDGSPDMLSIAQEKTLAAGQQVLFLCQPMEELDLYGTVDTVFCTLDSLNHLSTEQQLKRVLERVTLFLEPGGYFLFDVNTIYKHEKVLANNTFVYDTPEVYCVWQNALERDGLVKIQMDFFERVQEGYVRTTEQFSERAYPVAQLKSLLAETGMDLTGVFHESGTEDIPPDAQRILCMARRTGEARERI